MRDSVSQPDPTSSAAPQASLPAALPRLQTRTPAQLLEPGSWIRKARLRALTWIFAIALATIATIMFAGVPAWPVVGVAVAAACVSMGKLSARLTKPTCLECGDDLSKQPISIQGITCPTCGAVSSPGLVQIAQMGERWRSEMTGRSDDEASES